MDFRELLPDNCPPEDAHMGGYEVLYRFVPATPATNGDFDSHAAKGKAPPPTVDPCRWSSCSFFRSRKDALSKLKLPKAKARFSHFAVVNVPQGSGYSVEKSGHVDLWMFSTFDPVSAIVKYEEL